ncbi:MAG: prenyltransferase/squalene oxidase repeat-containing protein [Candidatus Binatia bacterium]
MTRMIERARDFLLAAQNPDGGWGAGKGRRSNTEATALTVLGLSALKKISPATSVAGLDRGLNWLVERQYANGSWSLTDQIAEASWTTALAVLALAGFEDRRHHAVQGGQWLLQQYGRRLGWIASLQYRLVPETMATRLNPDLQGWSWATNTFSWVEPTACPHGLEESPPFSPGSTNRRENSSRRVAALRPHV